MQNTGNVLRSDFFSDVLSAFVNNQKCDCPKNFLRDNYAAKDE